MDNVARFILRVAYDRLRVGIADDRAENYGYGDG
jgi:hypothetical protein